MNIYTAIMKTANLLEKHPDLWDFHKVYVPKCDSPGCALGWIGFFMGRKAGDPLPSFGISSGEFYDRLSEIQYEDPNWINKPDWTKDGTIAARCLRTYAERYYDHEKSQPQGIPSNIYEIFDSKEIA